jgi:RNA polymerase subunit RPABC4/transcription elongation factor Spt4
MEDFVMYCRNCGEQMNENQAICLKCGVATGTGKSFCHNCGNAVAEEAVVCVNCGVALKTNANGNATNSNTNGIKHRSIVTAILLSIVTCGIYGIFWFISLTNDMNTLSGRVNDTNGGTAFLLTLVTCGIYGYIWAYKLGEKRDIVANEKGSSNILYLILTFFGLGVVVYGLAQDTINKAIANK